MKKVDLSIFIPSALIAMLGLVTLLSTEVGQQFDFNNIFIKQIIFVTIGVFIFFLVSRTDISILRYSPLVMLIYIVTVVLLILTLVLGQEVNGAKRWLSLFGVQLQPSEIAKVVVIFVTAHIFTLKEKYNEWALFFGSFITIIPILVLVYLEPHGSMSVIILVIWALTAFISMSNPIRNTLIVSIGVLVSLGLFLFTAFNASMYLVITLIGLIISVFAFFSRDSWRIPIIATVVVSLISGGVGSIIWNNVLADYQRQRIVAFTNPAASSPAAMFNVDQSKIAIGSGGILGKGFANGSQTRLKLLPFHQTDFIFAAYAEEFGLIGGLFLFILYILIFFKTYVFSLSWYNNLFDVSIAVVLATKIMIEVFINLGTNLGVIPATGIPLPLMSAGGTITVMTFFSLGVIQCIISNINQREQYKLKS